MNFKDSWTMIRSKAVSAYEIANAVVFITAVVVFSLVFLKVMIAPLGPAITFFLILGFTIHAIEKGQAVMAIGGVVLYLASWPATSTLGTLPGMAVWTLGVSLWFWALFRIVMGPKPRLRPDSNPAVE